MDNQQELAKQQDQFVIEQLGVELVNLKIEVARLKFIVGQLQNTEAQQESQNEEG